VRRAAAFLIALSITIPGSVPRRAMSRSWLTPRPAVGEPEGAEREDGAAKAAAWWHVQRAFPAASVPLGAHLRGRQAMRALRKRALRAPGPKGSTWTPLGPGPLDTSMGALETPNMGPVAGRASAVAVDPTDSMTIYAGYALGGVWKTSDGGATWAPLSDYEPTLAVGSIAIDPAASETIYVGTGEAAPYLGYSGEGIFKSTDGGKSFTKIGGTTLDGFSIGRLFLDVAAGAMYATAFYGSLGRGQICNFDVDAPGQGLYRSTDGGTTWTSIFPGKVVDVEVDTSVMPRRLFVGEFEGGAMRSDDGGGTWVAPAGLPKAASRVELALSAADPSIVYAGMGLNGAGAIYVSQDGGKSFTSMAGAPDYCQGQCYYDNAVAVDPADPKTLYVGGDLCGIWKTTNATDPMPTWVNVSFEGQACLSGQNWAAGFVHPDVHAIVFDPSAPSTVLAATDGGLSRSLDAGATWSSLTAGVSTLQIYALCADLEDPVKLYGGAQDNGSFMRTSASLTWRGLVDTDGGPCAVDPKNPRLILGSRSGASVFRTTDGFASTPLVVFATDPGTCQPSAPGCGDRVGFIAPLVGDPSTAATFYVGTYKLYKTTAGGAPTSWKAISGDLTAGAMSVTCPNAAGLPSLDDALTVIAVAPSAPDTLYTGSQAGRIFATSDGGSHWSRVDRPPLPARWVSAIAVDPRDPKLVFAAFSGFDAATPAAPGHVFRSGDGGASWELRDIGADLPVDALLAHPVGSDLLYAGTDSGLLVTTDGGKSWMPFDDGLPEVAVYALVYQRSASALVAGTYGRSAWSHAFAQGTVTASPGNLAFTAVRGAAAPAPQALDVGNSDAYGSIVSFTVAGSAPWLSVDTTSGEAAGAVPVVVRASVDATQLGVGASEATLTVTPGAGSPVVIPVKLTVTAPRAPTTPEEKSGCGCRVAGDGDTRGLLVLGAILLLPRWSRRRTSRRCATLAAQ
jgi:MYXO-CTERM domain-containing protein